MKIAFLNQNMLNYLQPPRLERLQYSKLSQGMFVLDLETGVNRRIWDCNRKLEHIIELTWDSSCEEQHNISLISVYLKGNSIIKKMVYGSIKENLPFKMENSYIIHDRHRYLILNKNKKYLFYTTTESYAEYYSPRFLKDSEYVSC